VSIPRQKSVLLLLRLRRLFKFILFLAWVATVAVLVGGTRAQNPQVTLPGLGTMEGYMGASYITERPFYHFRGVPFAKPPINELRFKVNNPLFYFIK
jgi:hypothetical protein